MQLQGYSRHIADDLQQTQSPTRSSIHRTAPLALADAARTSGLPRLGVGPVNGPATTTVRSLWKPSPHRARGGGPWTMTVAPTAVNLKPSDGAAASAPPVAPELPAPPPLASRPLVSRPLAARPAGRVVTRSSHRHDGARKVSRATCVTEAVKAEASCALMVVLPQVHGCRTRDLSVGLR